MFVIVGRAAVTVDEPTRVGGFDSVFAAPRCTR
jgi:hypothetical protein